jgi:hypothetical protein
MTKKTTEVARVAEPRDSSVETFISQAIAANVSVETLERLFGLREKVKAEQAREAFTQALADFQGNCPIIAKTKKVMNNTFAKRYALCNALGISTGDEDDDSLSTLKEKDAKSVKAKITLRLRTLGEKTETRQQVETAVERLTDLELEEKNYPEIAARLQTIIEENQADAVSV